MVTAAWQGLFDEIAVWRDAGRTVDFWWRDDDAGRPAPALARLIALAASADVGLALAMVPDEAQREALADAPALLAVIQHGVDHRNRAEPGGKKTEFPASEETGLALARLRAGHARLQQVAGKRLLPVLVPPWNRISAPGLLAALAGAGYRGLSRFDPRSSRTAAPGLQQVNTHVDIIDWRGSRGFAGEELVLGQAVRHLRARREGRADPDECTGWLTHHAVHDEAAWTFMAGLLARTQGRPGVRWRTAAEVFAGSADATVRRLNSG